MYMHRVGCVGFVFVTVCLCVLLYALRAGVGNEGLLLSNHLLMNYF